MRGIFARPVRLTPEFLGDWKAKGATAVVVPLDEETKGRWQEITGREQIVVTNPGTLIDGQHVDQKR